MIIAIPLGKVVPNPDQPRKRFDPKALDELAESIRARSLMQPITVRPRGDEYEIVAGERRWRAHCLLAERGQLPSGTIDAMVRDMDTAQRDLEAIVENMARADITPLEEAHAFQRMIDRGMSVQELADALGMKQSFRITERLQLLRLAPEYQTLFAAGQISSVDAYEIARLDSNADQTRVIQALNRGTIAGSTAVKAAVRAVLDGLSQADLFGGADAPPKPSAEEMDQVHGMAAKIEAIARLTAAGFKDGEVTVARRIAPDQTQTMAEEIAVIRKELLLMENQLRAAAAEAAITLN